MYVWARLWCWSCSVHATIKALRLRRAQSELQARFPAPSTGANNRGARAHLQDKTAGEVAAPRTMLECEQHAFSSGKQSHPTNGEVANRATAAQDGATPSACEAAVEIESHKSDSATDSAACIALASSASVGVCTFGPTSLSQNGVLVPWAEHEIDGVTDVGVIGRPSTDLLHWALGMSQLCPETEQQFCDGLNTAVHDSDARCDLEAVDEAGNTILMIAARTAPYSVIEQLVVCCASVFATNPRTEEGVLESAARHPSHSESITNLLKRYGARRLCRTTSGVATSPIHFGSLTVACEARSIPLRQHCVERCIEREKVAICSLGPIRTFIRPTHRHDTEAGRSVAEHLSHVQYQAIPAARQMRTAEAVAQSFCASSRDIISASCVQEVGVLQYDDRARLISEAILQPEAAAFFQKATARTDRVAAFAQHFAAFLQQRSFTEHRVLEHSQLHQPEP